MRITTASKLGARKAVSYQDRKTLFARTFVPTSATVSLMENKFFSPDASQICAKDGKWVVLAYPSDQYLSAGTGHTR